MSHNNTHEKPFLHSPLETPDEEKLQKAKDILGSLCEQLTDEQIKTIITEIQFLTDTWLDEFEREIFNGKTIQELLSEEILL